MGERSGVLFLVGVLVCSALAGCLSDNEVEEESLIDLVVYYDLTNGTIQQSFIGGSQISFTGVTFSFDFAYTTSEYGLESFYVDPGDGSPATTVDASDSANIDVEYQLHGLYTAVLGATDINGNEVNKTVVLRVEQFIEWNEANSAEPDIMEINTTPGNEEDGPRRLTIDSTVENPSDLFGGSPVTVSWELTDPNSESKGMKSEQIADGQEASWNFNLEFPISGIHELAVTIDQGQNRINIDHIVEILYDPVESSPNPNQSNSENEEENTESE
ncbi:MAG: hypothetical protein CMA67_00635 [Euryarchaeota archaeon]|nr:hypothetical protein [Euryarchaeota archaeon]